MGRCQIHHQKQISLSALIALLLQLDLLDPNRGVDSCTERQICRDGDCSEEVHCSGDESNYQVNGEFSLESFNSTYHMVYYSCCEEPYPDITYTIRMRRRPMFYVFNLILPCVLINGIGGQILTLKLVIIQQCNNLSKFAQQIFKLTDLKGYTDQLSMT